MDQINNIAILPQLAGFLQLDEGLVYDRLGIDGRWVSPGISPDTRRETPDGILITPWGTLDTKDYSTVHVRPLAGMTSVHDIDRYPWPDVACYDIEDAVQRASEFAANGYPVRMPGWNALFCRLCDMFGIEEAMVRMYVEPTVLEAALEHIFDFTVEFIQSLIAASGEDMHILCLGDDFATQRGLMISPDKWRVLLKPKYAKLFEIGKRAGKPVWFHACGDITEVLPDLIDIGMDVWETVQLHTLPISPEGLKREYGQHITFFGGINTQRLPFMTVKDVRDEVIRCIEVLGSGGGFICGPDHTLNADVSAANALALYDSAAAFRKEGYTAAST